MEPNPKYQLEGARGHVTRRDVLAALGVLALGGCVARTGGDVRESDVEAAQLLDDVIGVDMHSHAAGATGRRTPAYDLAARMRSGRMTAVCLQHTSDGPVIKRDPQNRVRVTREPDPGELWRFTQSRLAWFENLAQSQRLRRALGRGDLEAAHRDRAPAIVQAIEGCQFMEGRLEHLAEVQRRGVRHLQLVHFMRSDLGDNQTESPTQGGLTPLGRDVIAECNRLGMVVDVAHGTPGAGGRGCPGQPHAAHPVPHQPRLPQARSVHAAHLGRPRAGWSGSGRAQRSRRSPATWTA